MTARVRCWIARSCGGDEATGEMHIKWTVSKIASVSTSTRGLELGCIFGLLV